jgi:methane monooxygenase PmoA-like
MLNGSPPAPATVPSVLEPGEAVDLQVDGTLVASYVWTRELPLGVAPRPYLHPVRTLAGVELTGLMPSAFRHHLGAGVAIADVSGHNFWGGRTFLPGRGPTWLDNHGSQVHRDWRQREPDRLVERLAWLTRDGAALLEEERTLAARPLGPGSWRLELAFALTNVTDSALPIASPACAGRAGAGYGGFFWRLPADAGPVRINGPGPDGPLLSGPDLNGIVTAWLGVAGTDPGGRAWTLVFVPGDQSTAADPWFVRARDYAGVGSALAWARPLVLAPGAGLARQVAVVLADGHRDAGEAAALAAAVRA